MRGHPARNWGLNMTQSLRFCIVGLAAAFAAGCSAAGGAGHPSCRDAQSTTAYGVKWQDDLAVARHSGTLTVDQVVDAHGKIFSKLSLLKQEKYAEYCDYLDEVRKETGF